MLLGARMLFDRPKLPYDAEVEYLESAGTQWIDTGLPITDNVGYQAEVEFRFTSLVSDGGYPEDWVYGYWNSVPSARLYLIGRYMEVIRGGAGPDNSTYHGDIPVDDKKHKVALLNRGVYIDGVLKCETRLNQLADPIYGVDNVLLGKSPHVDNGSTRQIFSCKIWSIDDTALRDFIPVRFTNEYGASEGAMYDRVSGEFFRNQGTGAFIIGPDR